MKRDPSSVARSLPSSVGHSPFLSASRLLSLLLPAAFLALPACSDLDTGSSSTGPQPNQSLEFRVQVGNGTDPNLGRVEDALDEDVINVTESQIVVGETEIRRSADGACVDAVDINTNDQDPCVEFNVSTDLLELPIDGGNLVLGPLPVVVGTYDRLEMDILRAEDPLDVPARPDLATNNASFRIVGFFNGQPFEDVFLDPEVDLDLTVDPAAVVSEGTGRVVLLQVEVADWFVRPDGSLIDPASLQGNAALRDTVVANVLGSFSATSF